MQNVEPSILMLTLTSIISTLTQSNAKISPAIHPAQSSTESADNSNRRSRKRTKTDQRVYLEKKGSLSLSKSLAGSEDQIVTSTTAVLEDKATVEMELDDSNSCKDLKGSDNSGCLKDREITAVADNTAAVDTMSKVAEESQNCSQSHIIEEDKVKMKAESTLEDMVERYNREKSRSQAIKSSIQPQEAKTASNTEVKKTDIRPKVIMRLNLAGERREAKLSKKQKTSNSFMENKFSPNKKLLDASTSVPKSTAVIGFDLSRPPPPPPSSLGSTQNLPRNRNLSSAGIGRFGLTPPPAIANIQSTAYGETAAFGLNLSMPNLQPEVFASLKNLMNNPELLATSVQTFAALTGASSENVMNLMNQVLRSPTPPMSLQTALLPTPPMTSLVDLNRPVLSDKVGVLSRPLNIVPQLAHPNVQNALAKMLGEAVESLTAGRNFQKTNTMIAGQRQSSELNLNFSSTAGAAEGLLLQPPTNISVPPPLPDVNRPPPILPPSALPRMSIPPPPVQTTVPPPPPPSSFSAPLLPPVNFSQPPPVSSNPFPPFSSAAVQPAGMPPSGFSTAVLPPALNVPPPPPVTARTNITLPPPPLHGGPANVGGPPPTVFNTPPPLSNRRAAPSDSFRNDVVMNSSAPNPLGPVRLSGPSKAFDFKRDSYGPEMPFPRRSGGLHQERLLRQPPAAEFHHQQRPMRNRSPRPPWHNPARQFASSRPVFTPRGRSGRPVKG